MVGEFLAATQLPGPSGRPDLNYSATRTPAASPGQGGHLHVNLATQDHWASLLLKVGMHPNVQKRDRLLGRFAGCMRKVYAQT